MKTLQELANETVKLSARFDLLKSDYIKKKSDLKMKKAQQKTIDNAQAILQQIAETTQNQLSYSIESIVTASLSTIFDNPYEFKLYFVKKRNKTEVDFRLIRDNLELDNPLLSTGGGVVDATSFSLRIASLLLSNKSRILILDEPFKALSRDLQAKAGELIDELSKKLHIQFIMITHETTLLENIDAVSVTL